MTPAGVHDFYEPLAGLFTDATCAALLATRAGLPTVKDRFASVLVTPVPPETHRALYENIFAVVAAANARAWRLSLDGWLTLQFLEYGPGDAYPWHTDLAEPRSQGRVLKLALSLLLSPSESFEGGELELTLGSSVGPNGSLAEQGLMAPLHKRGDGVLFPSYLVHRIRPVTAGRRVVLVARLGGPAFK